MMRSDRKPPLARSPVRLRPRRVPRSNADSSIQTLPPGSLTKTQVRNRGLDIEESELRPEYRMISWELRVLAKMVHEEFGNGDDAVNVALGFANASSASRSPLFERGRFYNEYCARRNERLKRKKGEMEDEKKRRELPRYLLRSTTSSSKENKKPPLAEKSLGGEGKIGARRKVRKN